MLIFKRIILLLIFIGLLILFHFIDFEINNGYFKSDIDNFEKSVDIYSIYAALIFIILSVVILHLKYRKIPKSLNSNIISPEYLKYLPHILFIAFVIYGNFTKVTTTLSLFVNKQKELNNIERDFRVVSYDKKQEQLLLRVEKEIYPEVFSDDIELYTLKTELYQTLENKKNIKLIFKTGLLGIPFDPKIKK